MVLVWTERLHRDEARSAEDNKGRIAPHIFEMISDSSCQILEHSASVLEEVRLRRKTEASQDPAFDRPAPRLPPNRAPNFSKRSFYIIASHLVHAKHRLAPPTPAFKLQISSRHILQNAAKNHPPCLPASIPPNTRLCAPPTATREHASSHSTSPPMVLRRPRRQRGRSSREERRCAQRRSSEAQNRH